MARDQLQQLKDELKQNLPEIRIEKEELQHKLPEILLNLSEVLHKFGVAGAIEIEVRLDLTKLQSILQDVDNPQGQAVLRSALENVEAQEIKLPIKALKYSLMDIVQNCPCHDSDPDWAPCCVVSG